MIPAERAQLTLLLDAEVFAPEPVGKRSLLLGGGRILRVFEQAPALTGLEADVVDLGGRRLVPGFIDSHAHVIGGGAEAGYGSSAPPVPAGTFFTAGVTSVVGVLGTDDLVRTPGMLVHGVHGLRADGLSAWCHTGGYHVPPPTITGSVRGDIVHVDPVIGVGEIAISDHRSSQPTADEIFRLGAEAHVAGLMTGKAGIAHLHLGVGSRGLELVRQALDRTEIPARVWSPTHVSRRRRLLDEAFELASRGVVIDITATPEEGVAPARAPEDKVTASAAIAEFLAADGPAGGWTASTDAGGSIGTVLDDAGRPRVKIGRPHALSELLRRLVDRGIPLEQALRGLTENPATHLRLAGKGRIEEGADADVVALDDALDVTDVWSDGIRRVADGSLTRPDRFAAS